MVRVSQTRVEFCLIGSCAVDILESAGKTISTAGGTVVYTAATLRYLGAKLNIVANCAKRDAHLFRWMTQDDEIAVNFIPSPNSITFQNIYDRGDRTQVIECVSDEIKFDISSINPDVLYFGPLVQSDIDPCLYSDAHNHSALVVVDMQGWTRPRTVGPVSLQYHPAIRDIVRCADIIKVNDTEARFVFGTGDPANIAKMISSDQEVLLTLGERGAWIVRASGNVFQPAILPAKELDPSGCGDVFCATYAFHRVSGASPSFAAREAAKLASVNVATIGVPFLDSVHRRHRRSADTDSRYPLG